MFCSFNDNQFFYRVIAESRGTPIPIFALKIYINGL